VARLGDDPRSRRLPKLTEPERQQALTIVLQEPRTIKTGLKRIADVKSKLSSEPTLRTLLKAERHVWKRMRRSAWAGRDEAEVAQWRATALGGKKAFDLWDYDPACHTFTNTPAATHSGKRAWVPEYTIMGLFG
jgi:hypothetical protein